VEFNIINGMYNNKYGKYSDTYVHRNRINNVKFNQFDEVQKLIKNWSFSLNFVLIKSYTQFFVNSD